MYYMEIDDVKRTADWVVESSGAVDLINITGGEPTMHPRLLDVLDCWKRPEIGRVTMNSNGLRLAADRDLCAALAERNIYVILSFNTFDSKTSVRMHGRDVVKEKLQAIENLTEAGAKMTLLNVMARGVNEDATGGILNLMRENDNILSLTVQTMTYTGQGGGSFDVTGHVPIDEAAEITCRNSGGDLKLSDFHGRPGSHPLCYLICYMLKSGEEFVPFARLADPGEIAEMLRDSYLLHTDRAAEFCRSAINDLYAREETEKLRIFRKIIEEMYPGDRVLEENERQRIAESSVRTVYIHTHMDEDNFDCSRAMTCPDLVPCEPGRLIPACTYNLFYRMQDERFYIRKDR
jgi:uncharacterized radical SAM superfamily Fe-S cluster-containing enzyme